MSPIDVTKCVQLYLQNNLDYVVDRELERIHGPATLTVFWTPSRSFLSSTSPPTHRSDAGLYFGPMSIGC